MDTIDGSPCHRNGNTTNNIKDKGLGPVKKQNPTYLNILNCDLSGNIFLKAYKISYKDHI